MRKAPRHRRTHMYYHVSRQPSTKSSEVKDKLTRDDVLSHMSSNNDNIINYMSKESVVKELQDNDNNNNNPPQLRTQKASLVVQDNGNIDVQISLYQLILALIIVQSITCFFVVMLLIVFIFKK
jgi:hypothetical protein